MDQFTTFRTTDEYTSQGSWNNQPDSQTQAVIAPNSPELHRVEELGYGDDHLVEPLNNFIGQQSPIQDKGTTADGISYDAGVMDINFNEWLVDPDLSAVPSETSGDDSQPPTDVTQLQFREEASLPEEVSVSNPSLANSTGPVALPSLPRIIIPEAPSTPEPVDRYQNHILNLFTDPSTSLSVIDMLKYPFEEELQVALEQQLQYQQDIISMKSFQSGYLTAAKALARRHQEYQFMPEESRDYLGPLPLPAPVTTSSLALKSIPTQLAQNDEKQENKLDGMKRGNRRPLNIKNFDAAKFYAPLKSRPKSWGTVNPETNEPLFRYTEFGELHPLSTFTPAQIIEYIGQHQLNKISGSNKESGLTLLIQTVPADSGRRYPNRASDKCRFAECPDSLRTIRKGDFRVAFDEQSSQSGNHDPYHNAGYVHLFCLEKFLDFPQLCKDFNVQPDIRVLPEGKNKMAITRDHDSMEDVVRSFLEESVPWNKFGNGIRPVDYYMYTLNYKLTEEHLKKQPQHLQKVRNQRGGNSIDVHMNDLNEYVRLRPNRREETKDHKRRREETDDDESSDEDVL